MPRTLIPAPGGAMPARRATASKRISRLARPHPKPSALDPFTAKALAYQPAMPPDIAQRGAMLLHRLLEDVRHTVIPDPDRFSRHEVVVIAVVMAPEQFDELAAWGSDWAEHEQDEDNDAQESEDQQQGVADAWYSLQRSEDAAAIVDVSADGKYRDPVVTFRDFEDSEENHDQEAIDEREPDESVGAYL